MTRREFEAAEAAEAEAAEVRYVEEASAYNRTKNDRRARAASQPAR